MTSKVRGSLQIRCSSLPKLPDFSVAIRTGDVDINSIIEKCTDIRKEVINNAGVFNKQINRHQSALKKISVILDQKGTIKNKIDPKLSKDIHEKFKRLKDTKVNEKKERFSKLLVFGKTGQITDEDLHNQEAIEFLASNKREFGSPLKQISVPSSKIVFKQKSLDLNISPEETILQDIFAIKNKKIKGRTSYIKLKTIKKIPKPKEKTVKIDDESDEKFKAMSSRNRFIYNEIKKLDPVDKKNNFKKKSDKIRASILNFEKIQNKL